MSNCPYCGAEVASIQKREAYKCGSWYETTAVNAPLHRSRNCLFTELACLKELLGWLETQHVTGITDSEGWVVFVKKGETLREAIVRSKAKFEKDYPKGS